jgi:hypothetical protein
MPSWSRKDERQYEHIKESELGEVCNAGQWGVGHVR